MSLVHLHLLLNHVPVIGTFFVLFLLVVALWRRSSETAKLGLFLMIGIAITAGIVFLTGEPAEEAVEHVAGISEAVIHSHEEAAEASLVAAAITGALGLGLLAWFWRRELPRWAGAVSLAATLAVGGLMAWTANLGGQIRHTEIGGAAVATQGEEADDR
jgi:hypothetical protein